MKKMCWLEDLLPWKGEGESRGDESARVADRTLHSPTTNRLPIKNRIESLTKRKRERERERERESERERKRKREKEREGDEYGTAKAVEQGYMSYFPAPVGGAAITADR